MSTNILNVELLEENGIKLPKLCVSRLPTTLETYQDHIKFMKAESIIFDPFFLSTFGMSKESNNFEEIREKYNEFYKRTPYTKLEKTWLRYVEPAGLIINII